VSGPSGVAGGTPVDVYVSAGSNVRPHQHLARALELIARDFGPLRLSRVYENAPVGFAGENFLNLVLAFTTRLSLAAVLERLHQVEEACGRPRGAPKWEPRNLDLDVLLYGDAVGEFPGAVLPRPDLLRRAFMLGPLAEIAPTLAHPTLQRPIGALWAEFDRAEHPLTPVALDA